MSGGALVVPSDAPDAKRPLTPSKAGKRAQNPRNDRFPLPRSPFPAPMIDIGTNLTHDSFDHARDAVLARARAAGVTRMLVTGASSWVVLMLRGVPTVPREIPVHSAAGAQGVHGP